MKIDHLADVYVDIPVDAGRRRLMTMFVPIPVVMVVAMVIATLIAYITA
jgi:hypothetical protein